MPRHQMKHFTQKMPKGIRYTDLTKQAMLIFMNFITFRKGTTLPDGTEGNYSEHMSSFEYVYADKAVREWLLSHKKGDN